MPKHYLSTAYGKPVPQSEPLPGQTENAAGGYTWQADKWQRLRRFLVIGTDGGTYYIGREKLTRDNFAVLDACMAEDHARTLATVVEVSERGLAPKNDFAIFALARLCSTGTDVQRREACAAIPRVCRTGTHLFMFCEFVELSRGWGRMLRTYVARWYEDKHPKDLAYQVLKYRQREGYTHRDVLRLAHPKASTPTHAAIYDFACGREYSPDTPGLEQIEAFTWSASRADADAGQVASIIREKRLTREMVHPDFLADPKTLRALAEDMPMSAMVRNLGNLTRHGVLTASDPLTKQIVDKLTDPEAVFASRIHPFNILIAARTYASGQGKRGKGVWKPIPKLVTALDAAFYHAFDNVEATGKSWLLAFDVSPSMFGGSPGGLPITPMEAGFAMGLVTGAVEDRVQTMAFHSELAPVDIIGRRLDDVLAANSRAPWGGTDCSLPMLYAMQNDLEIDAFVVYTDNETWAGKIHPAEALRQYRKRSGIEARLIVCGMAANRETIADPNDPGMLDVVGLDASTPQIIASFGSGEM